MKSVNAYTTTLNQANAYWMAVLAKAAYKKRSPDDHDPDETQILKDLQQKDSGFSSVKGYSKNSAQAILVEHKEYLCMVFRGTDEIADWLDNINAFPEHVLFGKFHRGFWNSVEDIWKDIYGDYTELFSKKRRPLFLAGHSLGGAMATVAAARLIDKDLPFVSVYTFGQPRVMSRSTSRIFNMEAKSRFFRFHNNNDLVTRVPSRLMGYSHVGTYLYISQEQRLNNDPGFWFRFMDYVDGALDSIAEKGLDGIEDHNMNHYLEAIEKWDFEN